MTEGKAKLPYWLEGDDRFKVDGRLAIHGTGTEDYFNCGWYALQGRLDGPVTYAVHGFPVYRNEGGTWQVTAYRWHLGDPVPFTRTIEAGIEHGGDNTAVANYCAAVFWYSQRPGLWPPLSELSTLTNDKAATSISNSFSEVITMALTFTVGGARDSLEPRFAAEVAELLENAFGGEQRMGTIHGAALRGTG